MDKWNEICFLIRKDSVSKSKESYFQNEIVHIFEKLGWSQYKHEIETGKIIPIGANGNIIADIIISLDEKKLFVIELKRPTNPGCDRNYQQLISYMLQLRMKFGFFIGRNLQFFYDNPNDKDQPIKLIEIDFTENNEEGSTLIELLKRETFNEEKLIKYCNEKIEIIDENKIKEELISYYTSIEGVENILQLIANDLKEKYNDSIVERVINQISIFVKSRTETQNKEIWTQQPALNSSEKRSFESTSEKLPIFLIPSDTVEFKADFLKSGKAILCYHYTDGRVEEKIWELGIFNENSSLMGNLRSRPESRKGKWKELGITKLVAKINQ